MLPDELLRATVRATASVTLTLAVLEALVGPLPATARWDHMYWTNSVVAKRNWGR